jgi:uncharacterized alkaline shock family protein YloU
VIEVARTSLGGITLDPKALSGLVRDAAESVEGARVVRAARTLDVSLGDDGVATVAVSITAPRRAVLPELGALVQQRIAEALKQALDTPPARVDVTIEGIDTEGES